MLEQRSEHRELRWARPGQLFDPRAFEVARIDSDAVAEAFVETHHYSGSYPSAAHRFGLYRGAELAGVAVFSVGVNRLTVTNVFGEPDRAELDKLRARGIRKLPQLVPGAPIPWQEVYELGRFVLRDSVPFNGESWFLARCLEQLAREDGVRGVISFSDPYPRRRADGDIAFFGHWGQIYQAANATYTGRGTARTLHLLPDARVLSDRMQQKIRGREKGWESAVAKLVALGAPVLAAAADTTSWLRTAKAQLTRNVPHPGNHRYVFTLERRAAPLCVDPAPRPKVTDLPPALQLGFAL